MNIIEALRKRRDLAKDYELTFNTPHGMRVLSHLFREAGITVPRMTTDHEEMLVDKGMQRIVWSIHRTANSAIQLDAEIEKHTKQDTQ